MEKYIIYWVITLMATQIDVQYDRFGFQKNSHTSYIQEKEMCEEFDSVEEAIIFYHELISLKEAFEYRIIANEEGVRWFPEMGFTDYNINSRIDTVYIKIR